MGLRPKRGAGRLLNEGLRILDLREGSVDTLWSENTNTHVPTVCRSISALFFVGLHGPLCLSKIKHSFTFGKSTEG